MSHKNKNKFRVGQTVQSVYDSTHTFVIDKSAIPERIFHEKGSNRWWTRNELQRLGAPENPATSYRLNGKEMRAECVQNACKRVQDDPTATAPASGAPFQAPKTTQCLECGAPFKPTREWQKFDRPTCRYNYRRRVKPSRAEGPHRGLLVVAAGAD